MGKNFIIILVNLRKNQAVNVQKILTEWGCLIKTRLGLHDGVLDKCTETGVIFLELVGDIEKHTELARKLNLLSGVSARLVEMSVEA